VKKAHDQPPEPVRKTGSPDGLVDENVIDGIKALAVSIKST
jgi:hypothetical protein